jgi:hypothetical protein
VRTVFGREKVDAVVHLAARAGVRPSIQSPQLYYAQMLSEPCIFSRQHARRELNGLSSLPVRLCMELQRPFHFPRSNI